MSDFVVQNDPSAILVFEALTCDCYTGDKKMIAFDPTEISSLEQCWYQEAPTPDEVIKSEVVNIIFKAGHNITVRATFDQVWRLWALTRGIDTSSMRSV